MITYSTESCEGGRGQATTRETQRTDLSNKNQYLHSSKRGLSCTFQRNLREIAFRAGHRWSLLRVSRREIQREFRSFVRRSRTPLTTTRHYYTGSLGPDHDPAFWRESRGDTVRCIRTLGRILDIQRLPQNILGATQMDAETFSVGWDMGAEWPASHEHFCTPGSCSRYSATVPHYNVIMPHMKRLGQPWQLHLSSPWRSW